MNTETVRHIPAHGAVSVVLTHGITDDLSTANEASLLVPEAATRLLVGMRVFDLSAYDALLIPPFTYVSVAQKDTALCAFRLSFPYEILSFLAPQLLFRAADGGTALAFPATKRPLLHDALCRLESDALPPSRTLPALFSILEEDALPEEDTNITVHLPKTLRQALKHLNVYANEKPDVTALAARYGVSESTLARLFRTYLATTPLAYARAVARIQKQLHEEK